MINTWTDAVEIIGHFTKSYKALKEYVTTIGRSQEGNFIVVAQRDGGTNPVRLKGSEHDEHDATWQIELVKELQKLTNGEGASGDADYLLPVQAFFGPDRMSEESDRFYTVVEFPFGKCDFNKLIRESHRSQSEDLGDIVNAYNSNREKFALDTTEQVAKALNCAYNTAGVIHRDIKTSNIFVDKPTGKGGVKTWLGDFQTMYWADRNTALAVSQSRSLTTPGQLHGTYKYIPPEEIKATNRIQAGVIQPGKKNISNKTPSRDIYSLGLVMYQILTGTPEDNIIHLKHYCPEGCDNPQEAFMIAKDDEEEFYKYLGLDNGKAVSSFVFKEIIKKCLRYDKSKQETWEEIAKTGKKVAAKDTPWHERYHTHQELLGDLEFAKEFRESFDDIEALLSKSADEDSAELAKGLKPKENEKDRSGYIAQKIEDSRGSLRTKGYSTVKGRRHWIHEAFEANVLRRKAEEHAAEIAKCYAERLKEFEEGDDSTKNYILREEAGTKLREFAAILRGYAAISGGNITVSMPVQENEAERLADFFEDAEESGSDAPQTVDIGIEELAGSVEELAGKYSPEDFLKKLEETEPENEIKSKELIAKLDEYASSIVYDEKDKKVLARIESLKGRIDRKREAVGATLAEVKRRCDEARDKYLDSVTADAEKRTVQTGFETATDDLDEIGHEGFFEVRCTKTELTGIDYVLEGLYTGKWDATKKEGFEMLYKSAENGQMRFLATSSVQSLVGLAQEGGFFEYMESMFENFETEEKNIVEAEKRGDEIDEQKRKNSEDFVFGKRYFTFVKEHAENIASTALRAAGDAYSTSCKTDHCAATGAATEVLNLMPIANHPLVKARREVYEKREEYRKALSSTHKARGKIAGDLCTLGWKLKEARAISALEQETYNTLYMEGVIRKSEDPETEEEEETLRRKRIDSEAQLKKLLREKDRTYEDALQEDDLLTDIAIVMCLEGAERTDDAFTACDTASAQDKFANEPWFVYRLAENAVNFERDDERVTDTEKKLLDLEHKVHGAERGIYFAHRGDFYFKTAMTPGNLKQAAKDYAMAGESEKVEKVQDCLATVESINKIFEVDELIPLPETARSTLALKWKTVEGNIDHLKTALGEDHPFIDQTLLDLCKWVVDYERLVKRETEQDSCFIKLAETELSSLKSRKPRTDEESVALQAKIGSLERAVGAFKADRMRFRMNIGPFVQNACELFKGRDKLERWLAKIRGGR